MPSERTVSKSGRRLWAGCCGSIPVPCVFAGELARRDGADDSSILPLVANSFELFGERPIKACGTRETGSAPVLWCDIPMGESDRNTLFFARTVAEILVDSLCSDWPRAVLVFILSNCAEPIGYCEVIENRLSHSLRSFSRIDIVKIFVLTNEITISEKEHRQ